MASIESIKEKDISKYELRDIIDAMKNQLVHLERSQTELQAALVEEPNDVDFREAYDENVINIDRKKTRIKECKEYLMEIDIAYYMQHFSKDQDGIVPSAPVSATEAIQVSDSGNEGVFL